jgi:hypothetical protein
MSDDTFPHQRVDFIGPLSLRPYGFPKPSMMDVFVGIHFTRDVADLNAVVGWNSEIGVD